MSLFTHLAVVGVPGAAGTSIGFWDTDGTLLGEIATARGFDQGMVAVSSADDRIYSTAQNGGGASKIEIYDGDAALIGSITRPSGSASYAICVPEPGKVWISWETYTLAGSPAIAEYDPDGNFVQVIAPEGTFTSPNREIQPAYGMAKYGDFLYFNVLATTPSEAGIYKYDLVNGGAPVNVVPRSQTNTDRPFAFAMAPNGDLYLTQAGTGITGDLKTVFKYDLSGALVFSHTFAFTVLGIALAQDGLHVYIGYNSDQMIKVELATWNIVAQWSAEPPISGDDCNTALATPIVTTPSTTYNICRLRRAPHVTNERKNVFFPGFELDMEVGLGTHVAPTVAPNMRFRWSDDGGHTWSSYYPMSAGKAGEFNQRMRKLQLGKARDRVYEVSTCDDAAWRLTAAYLLDPQSGKW